MDERLDRISASACKTIVCCSVCRSPEVWTGIRISNEARYRTVTSTVRTVSNSFD